MQIRQQLGLGRGSAGIALVHFAVLSQLTIGLILATYRRMILEPEPTSARIRRWVWSSFSSCSPASPGGRLTRFRHCRIHQARRKRSRSPTTGHSTC